MDYAPMHVINLPPQDTSVIPTRNDHHHSSSDCHDQIMVTKDNVQALVIGVLPPHRDDTCDSDIDHRTDHVMSENGKGANGRETKIKLNFSVDRLLGADCDGTRMQKPSTNYVTGGCCKYGSRTHQGQVDSYQLQKHYQMQTHRCQHERGILLPPSLDLKAVVRPTPIRANMGSGTDEVLSYTSMASSLLKFHHHHHHQQQPPPSPASIAALSSLMAPFNSLKSLQINQQHFRQQPNIQSAAPKSLDIPPTTAATQTAIGGGTVSGSIAVGAPSSSVISTSSGKRKRSWSRAVFSNLQRKGLEIQFQQQKYITKPDRRKLAARLNLTDAQVKVWFQNRRMKWRHTRENLKSGQEKPVTSQSGSSMAASTVDGPSAQSAKEKCYTSSSDTDEDEINVVE